GCPRATTAASRSARSLDHDAIACQVSTSLGRSVMAVHAFVAARRITRQRRRGGAQRARMCRHPFLAVAASRRTSTYSSPSTRSSDGRHPGGELLAEREARRARLAPLDDPGVRLAGIREGLPLPERDVGEPLAASRLREPGGSTLAVVEDVRSLVDHEVLEAAVRAEVFARHQQVVPSLMPPRSGAPGPRGPRADAP